ncbi:Abscisic acid 8'-hydroxylase 4 [Achaetomium macrosporum]|uniref:Abscisic acid 8'-hydroxylase 4 n=1 Tax=Achaetomium macrosporum TaxID=79813 RepID=A0AAN7C825_9PEZI|nr:Abscisic acid 8'-hydroxylase 4 [Achaetomium macrosporum]
MESSYLGTALAFAACDVRPALLAIVFVTLVLWRFYVFTILPWHFPTDPKEYPYWIPVIGHLRSFYKSSSRLLSDARSYFGESCEPFALTVPGQKWYVLTKAEHVAATYKMEHLSYDIFAVEVIRMVGVSEDGIRKAFQEMGHDGGPSKHLVRLCKEYQLEQLSPRKRLHELVQCSVELLRRHLAYFGERLQEVEPDLIRIFMAFETLSWQAMYQYPSFFMPWKKFLRTPKSQRIDTSWFISKIEEEMHRRQIALADSAIFLFQLFWSINGNTRKAAFWMLSYIVCGDQDLVDAIRAETAPAMSEPEHNGTVVDVAYLVNQETCPRLNSIWGESARLTAFAASVRFLTHDIELGGKTLRNGNRLMMPQRQLHFSTQAFGHTATLFDPDRFLADPSLRRNPSLRPFGGGATMCPGRNLAKQTTLAFVAMLLHSFHLVLYPPDQKLPEPAEGKPSIGLVDVQNGNDLRVRLCTRKAAYLSFSFPSSTTLSPKTTAPLTGEKLLCLCTSNPIQQSLASSIAHNQAWAAPSTRSLLAPSSL